jgi:hypothetical protein
VSGPIFDWLRGLYARVRYMVRHEDVLSAEFKSGLGLLTGDTASPILWNVYFADIGDYIVEDPDDIVLGRFRVSHMEQADDIVLFSTTLNGFQRTLYSILPVVSRQFHVHQYQKDKMDGFWTGT